MTFDPIFKMPKISRREKMLNSHGYIEGPVVDGVRCIIPTMEKYKELCTWNVEPTPEELTTCYAYGRKEFALYSEPNEKFSEWMLRLGWLKYNDEGKLIEA